MAKNKPKLMIIDGNALIHRSFHALPPTMATKDGEIVNAVYGFTTALLKAVREFKPEYVVLTLDKKGPTFRHRKFKDYKAKRVKAPVELYQQIPRVKAIAQAFAIPIFEQSGFEADDLIGTIVNQVDSEVEKIILTGDLDTLQLVNEHTKVYMMSRGVADSVTYDIKAIRGRYGLKPEQLIDFKALRGDPSDNIPGVPGIGEKTALGLLEISKTLDGVYKLVEKNAKVLVDKFSSRIIELLKKHKEQAYLSQELVTIKRNIALQFNLADTRFINFDKDKVMALFSELEFKSLLPRLKELTAKGESGQADAEGIDKFARNQKLFKYNLVDDDKKFKVFLKKLKQQQKFAFDTETSSLDPLTAELLGISFSWNKGEAYYVKVGSKKPETESNNLFTYKNKEKDDSKEMPVCLEKLKPFFENEDIKKQAHNAKFDIRVMTNNGVNVAGLDFDTMIASYLLNPGTRQHNLDALTFSELQFEKISKADLLGKGRDKITFSEAAIDKLALYSCEDADFTYRLVTKLKKQLKEQKLDQLFKNMEMPLVTVLGSMEDSGVIVDKKILSNIKQKTAKKIKALEGKIYSLTNEKFNINSTQQLRIILFEKLAIPTEFVSKTKTGLSTAASELAKLKDLHPVIPLLQDYRELAKLANTYIDALPRLINKKTGRVHTSYNQAVTATGRLSSAEPNLQNIPIRSELGREIRTAFVAQAGYKLLSLDYSQIELRLAAHMSGDPKMIKAFKNQVDIHTATAAEINQVSPEAVTKTMRREAKAINFGILYGQGPHGLSQTADIPYARAREFIEEYFIAYKSIQKFIDKTIAMARKQGYVETLLGRRRYLPEINSSVVQARKAAERMAVNTPLQGTAADMIKIAMIKIANMSEFKTNHANEMRMILQVHDELVFEVRQETVTAAAKKIKKIMENVIKLKVPVVVDVSVGDNWGEMEEVRI